MSPSTHDGALAESRTERFVTYLQRPLQAVAFWAAIALPFTYLPLLAGNFETGMTPMVAFAGLLFANVVALVVGHGYGRE